MTKNNNSRILSPLLQDGTSENSSTIVDADQHKSNTSYKSSEKSFDLIVSPPPDFFSIIDSSYTYQSVNQFYLDSFKKEKDEIVGRTIADLHGKEVFENFIKKDIDKALAGEYVNIKHWIQLPDEKRYVDALFTPLTGVDGDVTSVAVIARDITEQKEFQHKIQKSEELLRTIVQAEPECVKTIDEEGKLLQMNPAGLVLIEADSFAEVEGVCVYDLVTEECRDNFIKMNMRVFNGETCDLQFEIIGLKGTRRWMETHAVPLYDNDTSKITGHLAITRDITESLKIERDLKESERKFRNLVEGSLQGIFVHQDFKPLFANQMCADMFGYDNPEEILKLESILTAFWVEEEQQRIEEYKTVRIQGKDVPTIYECKGKRKDGSEFWFENHVTIVDWDGEKAIQAATIDISERKVTENRLRESEGRFRRFVEHSPICMGMADLEGNILQVNKVFYEVFGYTKKDILNKNIKELVHPEELELSAKNIQQLLSGEVDHYRQKRRFKHEDGHYVWVDINVYFIYDEAGNPKYLANQLQDITEQIHHDYLQEAQRKILEQIVTGIPQKEILENLCLLFESLAPSNAKASILLLNPDNKRLYVAAAPGLSETLVNAFHGLLSDEKQASCGTAAYRAEKVIVNDVASSELWEDYKDFAMENGVQACWSTPFFSKNGDVLGTFAISLPRKASPGKHDLEYLETAGFLASIVIERMRDLEELSESEALFRSVFGDAPMGVALVDKTGVILQVNSQSRDIVGYLPEEIAGKNFTALTHPDHLEESIDNLKALMNGDIDSYQYEKKYIHKNGNDVWCRVKVSPVKGQHEHNVYAICHIEDITERKHSEFALQRYHRALEVVNQCNDTLFHATDIQELLVQVCNIIVDSGGYRFAWVGYADSDKAKTIIPMAKAGYENGYLKSKISWKRDKYYCPITEAILTQEHKVIRNIETKSLNINWREAALERGYRSTISLPLIINEKSYGAVSIYSAEYYAFDDDELKLLISLAENISFGIDSITNRIRREEAQQSLQINEQKFRTLFDENPSMFFTIDTSSIVLEVNNFGASELGYSSSEIIGRSFFYFMESTEQHLVTHNIQDCLNKPDVIHRWGMKAAKKDGTKLWLRVSARAFSDSDQEKLIFVVCEDITEERILSDKLVHEATHDGLTGLINRHEFENRLIRSLKTAHSENAEHVLCYMDLDRFKIINDTCGHIAGDNLLKQLSEMLSKQIRHRDSLARVGGDEFGLLMERCSLDKAEQVINKLKMAVADFVFYWDEKVFKVGVSIGMVCIDASSTSISDLIMTADNACYTAKDKGRDRIYIHQKGDAELENRRNEMLWHNRIQEAFDENRFSLFYQTIATLDSALNKGEHGEVLIRMEDEQGEIITPDVFIPVAERYNLIAALDMHVINMAFKWLSQNIGFLNKLYLFSINLSGASLVDNEVLGCIIKKLDVYNIPANKICFEVTETAAIANLNNATRFINTLKREGCLFALDDFGSGLSSFAYLKALPVDFLKIDGAFVKDIENEQSDLAIVKSIHEIGRALNKQTIAEFVENNSIKQILKGIGVDFVQGYGIARPRPLVEMS